MGSTYLMRGNKTIRFLTFLSTAICLKNRIGLEPKTSGR